MTERNSEGTFSHQKNDSLDAHVFMSTFKTDGLFAGLFGGLLIGPLGLIHRVTFRF